MIPKYLFHQRPTREAARIGRYQLLVRLGEGSLGDVHLAATTGTQGFTKLVVLKELRPDWSSDPRITSTFLSEARLAGQLNHANVVQTLEARRVGGRYFAAVEFLDGQPLGQVLLQAEDRPKVSLHLRLQLLCDALAGLHYAHEVQDLQGLPLHLVHGSFGASNVFVTYDGQVKVVDFGVRKTLEDASRFSGRELADLVAPEQLQGAPVSRRTDVFCAGALLWELLTRRPLVPPATLVGDASRQLSQKISQLGNLAPFVDPKLLEICERAVQMRPDRRFSTILELRTEISKYLERTSHRVEPTLVGELVRSKFRSHRDRLQRLIQAELGRTLRGAAPRAQSATEFEDETHVEDRRGVGDASLDEDASTKVDDFLSSDDATRVDDFLSSDDATRVDDFLSKNDATRVDAIEASPARADSTPPGAAPPKKMVLAVAAALATAGAVWFLSATDAGPSASAQAPPRFELAVTEPVEPRATSTGAEAGFELDQPRPETSEAKQEEGPAEPRVLTPKTAPGPPKPPPRVPKQPPIARPARRAPPPQPADLATNPYR